MVHATGFPGKKRDDGDDDDDESTLESSWILFQYVRFVLGARSKCRFYDCVLRAHVPGRARAKAPFVHAFDPFYLDHSRLSVLVVTRERNEGENDEQTPAGAYPVRWSIQRCKICIYDPEWTPKITKYKRRFSWFWIILHSSPWPPLTPLGTASTFQWNRKGPLARRDIMVRSFLFCPRKFHGPVRGDKGFSRGSLTDRRASRGV